MINVEYEMVPLNALLKEYADRNGDNNYKSVAVGRYGIRRREDIYSKELTKDFTKYKVIYKNTLTVGMGSNQIDIGVLSENDTYCVSPAYHTFKITNVDSRYLDYCLKAKNEEMFKKYSKRGSRQGKTIDFTRWLDYEIPICNEKNQKQIANNLKTIDGLIELNKNILNKFDELIKSQFVEMFGKIEKYTTLSRYIKELRGGKSLAGTEICENKVLKTGAASFGWFDSEQYKYLPIDYKPLKEHKVESGDVIISRMNTPELVGACSYVFNAPDNMYYPDRLWKVILKEESNPIFLWQLMWDKEVKRQIKEKSAGTSGTMQNISKSRLLDIKCIDAPIDLQEKYAIVVKQINKQKFEFEKQLKKLEEFQASLMQEYFG